MKDNDIEKLNLKIKSNKEKQFILMQDFQGNLLLSLIITLYKENPTIECGTTSSP